VANNASEKLVFQFSLTNERNEVGEDERILEYSK